MEKSKFKIKHIEILILVIVSLIVCLPLFRSGFLDTHDGNFHIARIFGTVEGIKEGQFLPEIVSKWGNGFGYSWNLFYPTLYTFFGAFLKLFLSSYILVMKAILIILTFVSSIGMYKLMMEITGKKRISVLTAIIYITVPYRLTDVFVRLAIGEVLTLSFMPILFQGLYNLINKDGKKDYLIVIGAIGIILSHNISTLLVGIVSAIYVLINIEKFKNKEKIKKIIIAVIFIITIVSFFYAPLLESKKAIDYAAFDDGFMMTKDGFLKNVVHIRQLFDNSFKPGRSYELGNENDNINEMSFSIGLQLIIPLLMIPLAIKSIKKEQKRLYWVSVVIGLICIIGTTSIFPWKYMPNIFIMLQVPWRLFIISSFLLSIASGLTIYYLVEEIRLKYLIVIIAAILIYIIPYFINLTYIDYDENEVLNQSFSGVNCANFEYFPVKARNNMEYISNREDIAIIINGDGKLENQNKNGTTMNFKITENNSGKLEIELPYIYYIGYTIKLNGEDLKISESDNGFLKIDVKDNETGEVSIQYTGTTIMNVTKIISIIAIILFIIYCNKNKIYVMIKNRKK